MSQCVTYIAYDGLYVNMTNRCSNDCDFCERNIIDSVGDADSLWLEYEPSCQEVLASITEHDLNGFSELVFCGFGEPMMRADDLLTVARHVKKAAPKLPIRINTNGHANLITRRDITPDMSGVIDRLSVSLNRADEKAYTEHMRPDFGSEAFAGLLSFVEKAKKYVPDITLTALDLITPDELTRCREIAEKLGVAFRVRATNY